MTNSTPNAAPKATPYSYLIFLLGALFYFYEYFLQISPSVMTGELMRDFRVDAAALGTISAFYYYTYTAFQVPAGLFYDRFGARAVMTIAILCCALGALFFGISNAPWLASFGRLFMGCGSAFAFVGALYLCLRWFPPHYFAILVGIVQLMGSLGAIFGETPFATLVDRLGWQHATLLMSTIGFGLAFVVFAIVRNKSERLSTTKDKHMTMRKALIKVVYRPQTWTIGLYTLLNWAPIAAFAGLWGVAYVAERYRIHTIDAASMMTLVWLGVALGCPFIGYISERIKRRRLPLIICAGIGFIAILITVYVPHIPQWAMLVTLFFIGFAASGQSLAFALIADIHPATTVSAAIGFNNMACVCGAIVSQPLIGQLLDVNWDGKLLHGIRLYSLMDYRIAFLIIPLCYIGCIILASFFVKETYCRPSK